MSAATWAESVPHEMYAELVWRNIFDSADWPNEETDTHLVSGLLSTSLTVLAADPAVGKTHLAVGMAAALLNGEAEFLGQEVHRELHSVAFLSTDADGATSIRRRLMPLVNDPSKQVLAADYPTSGATFDWVSLTDKILSLGIELRQRASLLK